MEGKVAIVTGGSSDIGQAAALTFAAEEAQVVIADVDVIGRQETARLVNEISAARLINTDVSKSEEVETLFSQAIEAFDRLDYAFNNAGIMGSFANTHAHPEDVRDTVMVVLSLSR